MNSIRFWEQLVKTICQKQAEISYVETKNEIQSRIGENSYKYFKLNLLSQKQNYLKEFSIEFQELSGKSELFYSFDDENPKSDSEYIEDNNQNGRDENFIDKPINSSLKFQNYTTTHLLNQLMPKTIEMKVRKSTPESAYYSFRNKDQKELIYFSVKGLSETNEFKIRVYDKYVSNENNLTIVLVSVILSLVFLTIICVALFYSIKNFRK